jgi:hypothetical protein
MSKVVSKEIGEPKPLPVATVLDEPLYTVSETTETVFTKSELEMEKARLEVRLTMINNLLKGISG